MAERTLTVKGIGKISLSPDQIVIDITVESKDIEYSAVTNQQFEKTEEIKNAIAEIGFDKSKIKTSSLDVNTDYENVQNDNGKWEKQFKGYVCTHHLSLTFDFDTEKLKWMISAITSCKEANPTFSVSFTVKDKEETTNKLLEAAVHDAAKKAAVLSNASGIALGDVLNITYNNDDAQFISPTNLRTNLYRVASCDGGAVPEMSIEPENIQSRLEVTLVWEIVA